MNESVFLSVLTNNNKLYLYSIQKSRKKEATVEGFCWNFNCNCDLSKVCPASHPMAAGIDSSPRVLLTHLTCCGLLNDRYCNSENISLSVLL